MQIDRHVRRSGDDYAASMSRLMPWGLAWPRDVKAALMKAVNGLAQIWGYVDGRAADFLEREADPRSTFEMLPDWERNWGLPDPCWSEAFTIGDRQKFLVQRMTIEGGQSRQFFIDSEQANGHTIHIKEFRPFMVGIDAVGDNRRYYLDSNRNLQITDYPYMVGPPENRFYWTAHVDKAKLTWFRCGGGGGQCGVDPHLRIGLASDLDCLLNRWKPAHTIVIFDYSGLQFGGQYAGTGTPLETAESVFYIAPPQGKVSIVGTAPIRS